MSSIKLLFYWRHYIFYSLYFLYIFPPFIPFIHSVVCLTTGPWILLKRVLHRVRSSASSFNFQYLLFSLRSSSSCLRLLPRLPVIFIRPSNIPSITCFRRQFLLKMWPIQLLYVRYSSPPYTSSFLTRSVQLIISILLQHHILKTQNQWPILILRSSTAEQ
jgi:hypothetical protein